MMPNPSVLVVSTDPQGSTVWWADRVTDLPFDFTQEHDPQGLANLKNVPGRVHVIANQKGGVGKTTITVNLAAVLQESSGEAQTAGEYRHVFVDTPGSLEDERLLVAALDVADDVIVPLPPEPLAFDPTARTIAQVIAPRGLPYRVVINNWDPRDGRSDLEQTIEYINAMEWPRAHTLVRRYKIHTRAAAEGLVVTQYMRNRVALEASSDFQRLALELWANT